MIGNNRFKREVLVNSSKKTQYGLSDPGGSTPAAVFTCKRPHMNVALRRVRITIELIKHREKLEHGCHCDFEYLKTGKTKRDTSRLCIRRPGKTRKRIVKQMDKHDKLCGCGAFDFPETRKQAADS
ncbi:hypothetical protein AUEXF2481DRAFT_44027 [Aureobasidium subglaciale EXF-2481]|uniref:Uncharacterized protein n=1 Tax=Aureobasidium subglaciale (strain EXF-2481) TaxID=1043005 RepID=A0A074YBA4_AURSE|nr:uncharacterized protein AUEXF2481DRAFT_44027 [Aureobasidium subglaciale EXF-2481]KEQ91442.1 hypothetical protein AUEXF2481DRAFT_44027 [Aureobasidium subglaciale EXF-2481]